MNKPTISYGFIGVAVAVVAMALMVGSASLTAYAQNTTNSTTGTAMTANSTNATANATGTAVGGNITIVEPNGTNFAEVQAMYDQMTAQDPAFANFRAMNDNCIKALDSGVTLPPTPDQCSSAYQAASDRWCGLEAYDAVKCEHVGAAKMVYEIKLGMVLRGEL